jgi:uncharacterized membrane protein YdjX (TVP38/TMEM64 family)
MSEDLRPPAVSEDVPSQRCSAFSWRRVLPIGAVVVVAVLVIAAGWHRELSLEGLVRHRAAIDDLIAGNQGVAVAGYVALYIVVVALSVPGALALTLVGGILFGVLVGGLAAAVGATAGAVCIFLIAKSTFGEQLLRRAGGRAAALAEGFCADAFCYLLFLRLIPVFPFWVVNLVAAVSGVRLTTFAVATAIGILPATFALAFVGAGLDSVIAAQEAAYNLCVSGGRSDCRLHFDVAAALTPELLVALTALGVLALIPIGLKRLRMRSQAVHPSR